MHEPTLHDVVTKLGDQTNLSAYEEMAGALTYHDKIKEVDGLPDMVVELNKECGEHREEIEAKIIATKAAERQIANVKQYMERPDLVLERVTSLRFHHAMKG